jgi:hypothetical protein
MMIQLNPTIPVVTPKGKGDAIGWIDYGQETDLFWVVFQTDTCECWTWANKDIRAQQNLTIGRKKGELLPAIEPQTRSTISNLQLAFESGFRRAKKGMNLTEALIEFDKLTKL